MGGEKMAFITPPRRLPTLVGRSLLASRSHAFAVSEEDDPQVWDVHSVLRNATSSLDVSLKPSTVGHPRPLSTVETQERQRPDVDMVVAGGERPDHLVVTLGTKSARTRPAAAETATEESKRLTNAKGGQMESKRAKLRIAVVSQLASCMH